MKLGDKIFIACNVYDRKRGFYVEAEIIELNEIWVWANDSKKPSVWKTINENGTYVTMVDEKLNEEEFGALVAQKELVLSAVFPWVEWPIGHAAYLGDEGFLTLAAARKAHGRFPKRHLARKMRKYLTMTTRFIDSTHKAAGGSACDWKPLNEYMRKGYV